MQLKIAKQDVPREIKLRYDGSDFIIHIVTAAQRCHKCEGINHISPMWPKSEVPKILNPNPSSYANVNRGSSASIPKQPIPSRHSVPKIPVSGTVSTCYSKMQNQNTLKHPKSIPTQPC